MLGLWVKLLVQMLQLNDFITFEFDIFSTIFCLANVLSSLIANVLLIENEKNSIEYDVIL